MSATKRQYLGEAIEEYLASRKALRVSPATIRNERVILGRLARVTGPLLVSSINETHALAHWAEAAKTKTSGLANDYTSLSLFFKWCRNTKRMERDSDPLMHIQRPVPDERERRRLPKRDFPRLLDAALHPRDRIALAIALYQLPRVNEIASARIGDLDLQEQRTIFDVSKGRRGHKKRKPKPISTELDAEYRRWLVYYTEQQGPLQPHWFLVPAKHFPTWRPGECGRKERLVIHDDRLKPEVPWMSNRSQIAKYALEAIGFPLTDPITGKPEYEGMHTLRRSGARALYDQLLDKGEERALTLVQRMLNHKSPMMTARYIGVAEDEARLHDMIAGKLMYPVDTTNVVELGSRSRAMGD